MPTIAKLSKLDRPREKLSSRGPAALSDVELLAAFLGSGTKGRGVMSLSRAILERIDAHWDGLKVTDLTKIAGVGEAKATQILAAAEFFRRRIKPGGVPIRDAADVLPLVSYLAAKKQEHFVCISLNGANEALATRVVSIGLVNQSQVHPREVFADPLIDRASGIIVAHNHPAGALEPSEADIEVTEILSQVGQLLGIPLIDHVIFGQQGYTSLLESGFIQP